MSRTSDTQVPLCVNCGTLVLFSAHEAGAWSHWHGGTFCRVPGSTYTASPVTKARPTVFAQQPRRATS